MFRALKAGGGSAVALAFLLMVVTQSSKVGSASAAPAERQLDCGGTVNFDPVTVTKATVHDSEVPCLYSYYAGRYQPPAVFQAPDDWLANTDIYLFNRTNKTIVYGYFVVTFPETPTRNSVIISLGIMPAVAAFDRLGKPIPQNGRAPLSFGPGQTLVIHLGDYSKDIASALKPVLPAALTKVRVNPNEFLFDDGLRWSPGGVYLLPDQEHPGQWTRMPGSYHPDGYGEGRQ
jgi:hypothetical protein